MQTPSQTIRTIAQSLGFDYCGIARAVRLDDDARRLESWLSRGMHGGMQYMEKYFELRVDPSKLVPGAKSVITLLMGYFPAGAQPENAPKVSRYAWGNDYHEVIREKLKSLLSDMEASLGRIEGRGFVDSAPVLERAWAQRSGLGWIGRNGNLITPKTGSYFFIATLITDLELEYDDPFARNHCGTCTRCIEACPTGAILPGTVVDGSKCISYFTIELKDEIIPKEFAGRFDNWMFGCDICQEVCPWNRFAVPHHQAEFQPLPEILHFDTKEWERLTESAFAKIFRHSPLKRAKFRGIQRNLKFIRSAPGRE